MEISNTYEDDPKRCVCLTWGRDPVTMRTAKGNPLGEWAAEHHVNCPKHPDNIDAADLRSWDFTDE